MTVLVTKEFNDVQDQKLRVPDQVGIMLEAPATTSLELQITLEDSPLSELADSVWKPQLIFGDNGASPDTITRNKGSWLDDGFRVGHVFSILNTVSNNVVDVVVSAVTDDVLSVATGTFAAETVAEGNNVSIIGSIPNTEWKIHTTVTGADFAFITFEYGPTAIRIFRSSGTGVCHAWVRG